MSEIMNLPADLNSALLADAGCGYEESDSTSYSIPYIQLLQPLSPIVADASEDSGIRAGMFYNTVSGEVMRDFIFVPAHFQRRFSRWSGVDGHFVGSLLPSEVEGNPEVIRDGFNLSLAGDTLTDTRIHYVVYLNSTGGWEPAIILLSRTQIKHSRRLVTMIRTSELAVGERRINPPSWAMQYRASVTKEKNDKGQWFAWNFNRVGPVADGYVYNMAKSLYLTVSKGELTANVDAQF